MKPITVAVLGFGGVAGLDVIGPLEAFAVAQVEGQKCYNTRIVGLTSHSFVAESGVLFRPHVSLAKKIEIDIHLDFWKLLPDVACEAPMRGDVAPIEQTGWSQSVDSSADRGDAASSRRALQKPGSDSHVYRRFSQSGSPRDDQRG